MRDGTEYVEKDDMDTRIERLHSARKITKGENIIGVGCCGCIYKYVDIKYMMKDPIVSNRGLDELLEPSKGIKCKSCGHVDNSAETLSESIGYYIDLLESGKMPPIKIEVKRVCGLCELMVERNELCDGGYGNMSSHSAVDCGKFILKEYLRC